METVRIRSGPQRIGWMLAAGLFIAAAGLGLGLAATQHGRHLLQWSAAVVVVAALLEGAAGLRLSTRGGAGTSHTVSGGLALGLVAFLAGVWGAFPQSVAPGPAALLLGVFCVCNGLFRALDVAISRPRASTFEGFDAGFTLVLGAVVLGRWHEATPEFVASSAGMALLVGGLSLIGSAAAWWRHPERPAYDDLQERIAHGGSFALPNGSPGLN